MKYEDGTYTLHTGRTFYANHGVLGLGLSGSEISEGWDSRLRGRVAFTAEERREIADEMKARWERWAVEGMA